MKSVFTRKEKAEKQAAKQPFIESIRPFAKEISPPLFISEARKTDAGLDADVKFVENLSGKPFREGMKIVVCEMKSGILPFAGVNKSHEDQTLYLNKITEGTSVAHSFIHASTGLTRLHELTHMQCNILADGSRKKIFLRLTYSEGFANFAECQRLGSNLPLRIRTHLVSMALMLEGACAAVIANVSYSLVRELLLHADDIRHKASIAALLAINIIYLGLIAGVGYIGKLLLKSQVRDVLFTRSLFRLTGAVGDASKAFQIALEKEPKKWTELLFPLKFYKDEIAAANAKKNEEI